MMMRKIQVIIVGLLTGYFWLGNAEGPGQAQNTDRTGSPVSPGYCGVSSCHSGGNFATNVTVLILDEEDEAVTEYVPDNKYTLKISIAATGAEGYGFQTVALTEDLSQAGAFGTAPSGTRTLTIGNRDYFEHTSVTNTSNFEIEWTAPSLGTGAISIFAAGNAVNRNFNVSGDHPDTTKLIIHESLASSLQEQIAEGLRWQVYPSMTQDQITAKWSPDFSAQNISVSDFSGKTYFFQKIEKSSPAELNILVSDLPSGIYLVRLLTNLGFQSRKFVKM